ncbi:MAG TPA: type II toxin-antitoxin system prevent-host-death family antitoxin [Anaerovoracaceae bacterium]|nr:type II toxin-antitoxin system prevent-host-death family antitoxin [Anaerovoracaceae bacterium]
MKVPSTEVQNNFGKYLKIASELEDVVVTRNGKDIAKLTFCEDRPMVKEEALNYYFNREGKMTYLEFLELTENSDLRYEYIDGEVYCLAAPTYRHQIAIIEISTGFNSWFKGKKCRPLTSPFDVTLVKGKDNINVVQPDVMVICDTKKVDAEGKYQGVPTLVVEVLSPSTRKKDMQKKLNLYTETGIKEYWMADPVKKEIYLYTFEDRDIKDLKVFAGNMTVESIHFKGLGLRLPEIFPE